MNLMVAAVYTTELRRGGDRPTWPWRGVWGVGLPVLLVRLHFSWLASGGYEQTRGGARLKLPLHRLWWC